MLGQLLIRDGVIDDNQLKEALALQKKDKGLLGAILIRLGYISEAQLVKYLYKGSKRPRIGELLVATDYITHAQLERALEIQKQTAEKLGMILVREGYVDQASMMRVLGMQAKSMTDALSDILKEAEELEI